jgi:hypothetical protein
LEKKKQNKTGKKIERIEGKNKIKSIKHILFGKITEMKKIKRKKKTERIEKKNGENIEK